MKLLRDFFKRLQVHSRQWSCYDGCAEGGESDTSAAAAGLLSGGRGLDQVPRTAVVGRGQPWTAMVLEGSGGRVVNEVWWPSPHECGPYIDMGLAVTHLFLHIFFGFYNFFLHFFPAEVACGGNLRDKLIVQSSPQESSYLLL